MVEYEQPNIVDSNVDLQVINQDNVDMELEEEQASSKEARTVPKWLIYTIIDNKVTFPLQGKTRPTSQQPELHYVHHALITEFCDEEPLSLEDALEKQMPPSGFTKSSVM